MSYYFIFKGMSYNAQNHHGMSLEGGLQQGSMHSFDSMLKLSSSRISRWPTGVDCSASGDYEKIRARFNLHGVIKMV